jgi:putative transposase
VTSPAAATIWHVGETNRRGFGSIRSIESSVACSSEHDQRDSSSSPLSVVRTGSCPRISRLPPGTAAWFWRRSSATKGSDMLELLLSVLAAVRVFFRSRADVSLEVLALRQQVAVLKRQRPRPSLTRLDRVFWITLRRVWRRWADVLLIVKPETVVRWHRAGFRFYWRWRSRRRGGRPPITEEIQTLIRRLATENPTWGAPRIHGELLKLGFDVSERSVARYLQRHPRRGDSGRRWAAFLANHREAIVACDFFTVPTLTFQLLWCFFVIEHRRRTILHVNVTGEPTAA